MLLYFLKDRSGTELGGFLKYPELDLEELVPQVPKHWPTSNQYSLNEEEGEKMDLKGGSQHTQASIRDPYQ